MSSLVTASWLPPPWTDSLYRATVVNIKGDSCRLKEKRLTGLFPGSVALPDSPTKGTLRPKIK